ncbi:DUF2637 domain-containing protein [Spongisporangium articulatum]|uniref:DUF2637 domain-containing protein n=1 Tax=Spongisporangium articulatum TaxID=3362603 RepID=A0ABW8AKV2_9ACTN
MTTTQNIQKLYRVRTFVRSVLALAVAASVAANVLHAQPNVVGRAIAAWSPLALLLTVELISRVPVHRPALTAARMTATATIAGIAAWVSYWHMVAVALRYGETSTSAHLLPLSVDGLVVVASVSLVEISARLRDAAEAVAADTAAVTAESAAPVEAAAVVPTVPALPSDARAVAGTDGQDSAPAEEPLPRPVARKRGRPTGRTTYKATVLKLAAAHPDWTVEQIAKKAGCAPRTVRRYLATETAGPSNQAENQPQNEGPTDVLVEPAELAA